MNQMTPPPKIEIIPASAPFSEAQRSWLNGFFAGLLSTDGPVALSAERGANLLQGAAGDADDGEAPWHDQTMPIAERMKLAEGRPMRRRMMAAMAQQDCGQCGYNCNDYAEAVAGKAEARLNLCVPGGKETARMLKALHEELEKAPAASSGAAPAPAAAAPAVVAAPGRSRDNPVYSTFLSRRRLNKPGSEKETWHIEFDLAGCGLDYGFTMLIRLQVHVSVPANVRAGCFSLAASKIGPKVRHGPHQAAQKSTRTMSFSSSVCSKDAAVSA